MSSDPLVVDIKANSLDDGPGIRSVVFFKGCPLSCSWCHNPEGLRREAELSYDAKRCVGSGECVSLCPEDALQLEGRLERRLVIDRDRCTTCFDCAARCPSGALSRVGENFDVEDLVARLLADRCFFEHSGGGVTVSGGEATGSMTYLSRLLERLQREGVHTLLETCGAFAFPSFESLVYPHLDLIYYDLKLFDAAAHQEHCGAQNERILENFVRLNDLAETGGVELLPRVPLVPGITATRENLEAIAGFLADHGVHRAQLIPYNPLWPEKHVRLGARPAAPANAPTWMNREALADCAEIFENAEIDVGNGSLH